MPNGFPSEQDLLAFGAWGFFVIGIWIIATICKRDDDE